MLSNTFPAPDEDLPTHLVETRTVRGLRRLGVGTVPFNIVAFGLLTTMSAFAVFSPLGTEAIANAEKARAAERVVYRDRVKVVRAAQRAEPPTTTAPAQLAFAAPTTTTKPPSKTSSSKKAAPTTTASPKKSTATSNSSTTTTSIPTSLRPVRCEDFTLQPEAQAAFDANRSGRAGLDGDGDGVACEQLPGKPAPAPIAARRIPTTEELLLPESRLYGVHTPQGPFAMSEIDAFSADAAKTPNTVMFFQNLTESFPSSAVNNSWERGMLPMITFEPIVQDSTSGQPKLADITRGDWDTYFTDWATAARDQLRPIAFRFGQEMNGNWYPWSDGRLGNATGDYVAAWRHLHDLFDSVGADNIIWVWSVNRVDNLPDKTLARVYPGDDYVDWIGISGYLRSLPSGAVPDFDFTFKATLDELHRVAPAKVIMLTEVGAGTTEANRVAWIDSFFQGLLDHPEIIGFSWFNDFKDSGDWRIQYSSATTEAFARGVANSRYGEIAPTT